jgi:hypothetical protein
MSNLTERQSQVLDLIRRYIEDTGYPPTRADIARELGFRSANAAEEHLRALARKGAIEMTAGASRGIRLSGESGIPVVGRVAAGSPLLAAEHIEQHVQVPARLFSPAADYFLPAEEGVAKPSVLGIASPTIPRIASHRRSSTHRCRGHAVNPPPGPGPKSQISGVRRGEAVLRRNPPHPCRLPVAVLATECPPHRWVLEPLAVVETLEKACIPGFARCGTRSTERLCCPLLACGALRRRTRRGATGTYSCVPRRTMAGSTASDAPRRSLATSMAFATPSEAGPTRCTAVPRPAGHASRGSWESGWRPGTGQKHHRATRRSPRPSGT